MKSARLSFSKALFYKNMQRFWPILAAYIIGVLLFGYGIANSIPDKMVLEPEFFIELIYRASEVLVLLVALFSIVAAAAVFSYMYNSRATAMINALPFDRKTVFFSNYLSGLFMVMTPLLLLFLGLLGIGLAYAMLQIVPLLVWLFFFVVLTLLLYSLAVFMGLITGNIIAHIAFYGIVNFLLLGLEVLVKANLGHFLYGYSLNANAFNSGYIFDVATPIVYASNINNAYNNWQWEVWITYLLAGIVLTWLAYQLYRQRRMENAGDVIAIKRLNPIFKYGVTVCSSLAFGSFLLAVFSLEKNFAAAVILYLLAGMIGYFTAEMLMQKTFRVWKNYQGFLVYVLIFVLAGVSVYYDWYGYASRMPEANRVEAVAFSHNGISNINLRLLEADRNRVYMEQLINMPDSMALTYGTPISLERDPKSGSYIYPVMENLSLEEMKSLWEITPGIYDNDTSIDAIYSLHRYMVENMPDIRGEYRQRRQDRLIGSEDLRYYYISFAYRLDSGKTQYYSFPVILPINPNDELDEQLLNQLAAIAGRPEERSKKASFMDVVPENLRYLDVNFHMNRYAEMEKKMIAEGSIEVTMPMTEIIEKEPLKIKPEDRAAFLLAVQADYQEMSDYQMLNAEYVSCANVDMQVEYPHLPSYNRFRDRSYHFELSLYNQNVFNFLQECGYLESKMVEFIKKCAG
ncbi:MAG: hypothetical protein ACOX6E_00565 [Syntrophomonadaceae bacterium]|jgi:hypothetical protein